MKLTKELKQKWIEALESGKYTQIQEDYTDTTLSHMHTIDDVENANKHCCLAVFDIVKRNNKDLHRVSWAEYLGESLVTKLIGANDKPSDDFKADYSNVLPIIKSIEIK